MKKIIILAISTVLFLSCNQTTNESNRNAIENQGTEATKTDNSTVQLSAGQKTLKLSQLPESIDVAMTNNTTDTITTGLHYNIQKFDANEWKEVSPNDIVFHDIGFRLRPNEKKNFETKLYKNQIDYTTGEYRVVKYYLMSDYQETKQRFDVYAEFTVED